MADRYLLESGAPDGYLLEDGSGVLELDVSAYRDAVVALSGLVGYWRLGETVDIAYSEAGPYGTYRDQGGDAPPTRGVTGLLTGDANPAATWGDAGEEVRWNKADDPAAYDLAFRPNTGHSLSVAAWIKPTSWSGNNRIMQCGADLAWDLKRVSAGDHVHFLVRGTSPSEAAIPIASVPVDGTYFIVATWEDGTLGDGKVRIYLNGALVATAATANTDQMGTSPSSTTIGNKPGANTAGDQFVGIIDEVSIWNRALTLAEIEDLYAVGTGAVDVDVTPGVASGTGAAFNTSISIAGSSGQATGTGAASNAALNLQPNAGAGTGTGAAGGTTSTVAPVIQVASGTGAAGTASANLQPNAGSASGSGAAGGNTSTVAPVVQVASGTGTAHGANGAEDASAIIATGSGQAFDATASTVAVANAPAGHASGTGAAASTSVAIASNSGSGTGSGSAGSPAGTLTVIAGGASGTGSAANATVTTEGAAANPAAGAASGTGAAYDATITAAAVVEAPTRPHGVFLSPAAGIKPRPKLRRRPKVYAHAGIARGRGRAFDARVEWDDDETAMLILLEAA